MSSQYVTPLFRRARRLASGLFVMMVAAVSFATEGAPWIPLFDGRTLNGWKQLGGKGRFEVRDGTIVGIVTEGVTESSYLTTEAEFGEFVFECEFRPEPGINSGIQFRSSRGSEKTKRVHGYQYEIDATPRALTGGIFEESRRGWLAPTGGTGEPLETWNKTHGDRLKPGDWNTMRIEARGPRIRTWLNGHLFADFHDKDETRFRTGIFALQVHSSRNPAQHGKEIAYRKLRVQKLD